MHAAPSPTTGVQPAPGQRRDAYGKLRAAGVPICLGSDEMNTDDSVNLWFVAKTAALLHTLATPDYRACRNRPRSWRR